MVSRHSAQQPTGMASVNLLMTMLLTLALQLFSPPAAADSFTASVDRTVVMEQETIQLTLTHDPQINDDTPDFSPLKKDFQVLRGPSRMSNSRWINGQSSSSTEWTLVIMPKRTGKLYIPSLQVNGIASNRIEINVKPMTEALRKQASKNAFFDIEVQPQPAYYVQGQILYTEKLFFKVNHRDATLSDLAVEDARVELMGEPKQYTSVIDGERVGVYERNWIIQPEKAGKLIIPGQRFQAMAMIQDPVNTWSSRRQLISAVTQPIELDIKPIPASYPTAPWLPAESLTLKEHFSEDPAEWKVGDPITRTLMIDTRGMSASQVVLPALSQPDGLKQYPDQPEFEDVKSAMGVSGHFQQSIAMVPTKAGTLTLPEISIPWWNTRTNKLEYATLPAKTLTIAANPGMASQPAAAVAANGANAQSGISTAANTTSQTQVIAGSGTATPNLFGVPMLWWAAIGWGLALFGWGLWLLQRRKPVSAAPSTAINSTDSDCWAYVKSACKQGDAANLRSALQQWLMVEQPFGARTLDQLANCSETLAQLVPMLDASLFSPHSQHINVDGRALLNELERLRKAAPEQASGALPNSLYPNV